MNDIAGRDADALALWFVVGCGAAERCGVAVLVLALNIAHGGAGWGVANKQRYGVTAVEGVKGYAVAVAAIVVGVVRVGSAGGVDGVGSVFEVAAAAATAVGVGVEGAGGGGDADGVGSVVAAAAAVGVVDGRGADAVGPVVGVVVEASGLVGVAVVAAAVGDSIGGVFVEMQGRRGASGVGSVGACVYEVAEACRTAKGERVLRRVDASQVGIKGGRKVNGRKW